MSETVYIVTLHGEPPLVFEDKAHAATYGEYLDRPDFECRVIPRVESAEMVREIAPEPLGDGEKGHP